MLNAQSHRKPNLDNLIHFLIFSLVSLLIVWSPSFQCNFCHFHWNQKPISISTAIGILNQCWYINTLIYWYTDILIYWYIDILMNWYSGQSCSKKLFNSLPGPLSVERLGGLLQTEAESASVLWPRKAEDPQMFWEKWLGLAGSLSLPALRYDTKHPRHRAKPAIIHIRNFHQHSFSAGGWAGKSDRRKKTRQSI